MSHYSELMKRKKESSTASTVKSSKDPTYLCDFPETDPYHFVAKEKGATIAEGSLIRLKLALDESYLRKKIKAVRRNKETLTAVLEY